MDTRAAEDSGGDVEEDHSVGGGAAEERTDFGDEISVGGEAPATAAYDERVFEGLGGVRS